MEPSQENRTGRPFFRLEPWPTAIVLFFVVVVAVNVVFIRLSMTSWTGVVTEGAYDKGVAFNKVLQAQKVQDALGWRVTLDDSALLAGADGVLRLEVLDRQGGAVAAARVTGQLVRPIQQGNDLTFTMTESRPGHYEAPLHIALPGVWDLKLHVEGAGGEYRLARRIQTRSAGLGG